MPTDTQGSYFLKLVDPDLSPTALLAHVFHRLARKVAQGKPCFQTRCVRVLIVRASRSRATAKILPIEGTCQAHAEEIVRLAERLVPAHFHAPNAPCKVRRSSTGSFAETLVPH